MWCFIWNDNFKVFLHSLWPLSHPPFALSHAFHFVSHTHGSLSTTTATHPPHFAANTFNHFALHPLFTLPHIDHSFCHKPIIHFAKHPSFTLPHTHHSLSTPSSHPTFALSHIIYFASHTPLILPHSNHSLCHTTTIHFVTCTPHTLPHICTQLHFAMHHPFTLPHAHHPLCHAPTIHFATHTHTGTCIRAETYLTSLSSPVCITRWEPGIHFTSVTYHKQFTTTGTQHDIVNIQQRAKSKCIINW